MFQQTRFIHFSICGFIALLAAMVSARQTASTNGLLETPNTEYSLEKDNPLNTWFPANNGLIGIDIAGVVIDADNPSIVYALAADTGVNKSTDGAQSWTGFSAVPAITMAIDPNNSSVLYTGGDPGGIFKSTDAGVTWASSGLSTVNILDVEVDPSNSGTIYAAGLHSVFKSTNGGADWQTINNELPQNDFWGVVVDPSNPMNVYAVVDSSNPGPMYKSIDGGASWFLSSNGITNGSLRNLTIDPSNPSVLYTGSFGGGVFKTTDAGDSWMQANEGLAGFVVFQVVIDPVTPSTVYAATASGVFKSTDAADTWITFNGGLTASTTVLSLAIDPVDPAVLYIGTFGAGVFKMIQSTDGGLSDAGLIVPGFEVEVGNASGPTTFFAIRNTSDNPVAANVSYHGKLVNEEPLRTDVLMLEPQQTTTQNVRSNLSDLEVSDGFANGLILITEAGASSAPNLEGDFFRVDTANAFATGDRLIRPGDLCINQEIRFVEFGSGSQFRILVDHPQGPDMPSFSYTSYEEDGDLIIEDEFFTSDHLTEVDVADLGINPSFGTVIFDFSNSGGGYVSAKYSAFGLFSVELNSACRD